MKVVFMGSPEFAVPILMSLARHYEVAAVYTQPDRAVGRGLGVVPPPVKRVALSLGLPVRQPQSLKGPEAAAQLGEWQPHIIVVAAYGLWLPRPVLDTPPLGCLNVHPSLLPHHRGASPVAAAILAGEEMTGVSLMLLGEGWDTGPLLAQASLPLLASDTTGSLTVRLAELGARLLEATLPLWGRGGIRPQPQPSAGATYSRPLKKEEGEIDWSLPALVIERRVRAFQPWPGCYTWWKGRRLKVLAASARPDSGEGRLGWVVAWGQGASVETGQGYLDLHQVQLDGRRALSMAEFLRGQRGLVGAILPQGRPDSPERVHLLDKESGQY